MDSETDNPVLDRAIEVLEKRSYDIVEEDREHTSVHIQANDLRKRATLARGVGRELIRDGIIIAAVRTGDFGVAEEAEMRVWFDSVDIETETSLSV